MMALLAWLNISEHFLFAFFVFSLFILLVLLNIFFWYLPRCLWYIVFNTAYNRLIHSLQMS